MLTPLVTVTRFAREGEKGTGSYIKVNGELVCFCLELPWRDNQRDISCIPCGLYNAEVEDSAHYRGKIIRVHDVPERSGILFHVANWLKQLQGCLAPCSTLNLWYLNGPAAQNEYAGQASRLALQSLVDKIEENIPAEDGKAFYLLVEDN